MSDGIRVADAHIHFFSHRFLRLLAGQADIDPDIELPKRLPEWDLPPADPVDLAALWIDELDKWQVSHAALIASAPGDESSVAAAVRMGEGRFVGYFMLNPIASGAAETLEQALASGMSCAALFPAMHGYQMTDPRVEDAVRVLAARRGTAVFAHCGVLSVGIRKKLGLKSEFDVRLSNPVDLHGLALRYPALPFIIPHFGAGYFREALMVASSSANVYLDTSSSNQWMAMEGLTLNDVFARALKVVGVKRLLFGTDSSFFPRGWNDTIFDRQMEVVKALEVPETGVKRIFGQNFVEMFQIL